ncbi:hypothetical protein R5H30_01275 [Sulfitobacter sp. D35]|uniref:hypothetical protein n=1 Tax=Sulfitobacter sp. D35 TaxID=3083252 RepID=UPI00296E3225|nr:hypothetical protein [Sulfitobacter sp. D35]MDW4496596.1 hypothetical protein [Sulfitobacter sp. D35]
MKLSRVLCVLFAGVLPVMATAQTFTAVNRLAVVPLGPGSFEVVETVKTGGRGYWCAAADYVRRQLGNPRRAQIYVIAPLGPSRTVAGARAVGFTITPDTNMAQLKPSYSAATNKLGTNLSVLTSYKYCSDANPKNQGGDN